MKNEKLVEFRIPTISRFWSITQALDKLSLLRALEYERLESLALYGRVLDFGGGSRINYADKIHNWMRPEAKSIYESANIDPKTEPTYLIQEDGEIPAQSSYFDSVISLNTFEHIYDIRPSFTEINRVLKPGGKMIFIVPFIFRVHGHPDDFFRGTPSFWYRFLDENGFTDVNVEALLWGPFSTSHWLSGQIGPFKRLRMTTAMLLDVLYCKLKVRKRTELVANQDAALVNIAMGFFISAQKPIRIS